MPVTALRAHLATVIASVEAGDRVLLTRHDKVVAALVPATADAPSALERAAAELLTRITQPVSKELPEVVASPTIDPTEWVQEIYEARR